MKKKKEIIIHITRDEIDHVKDICIWSSDVSTRTNHYGEFCDKYDLAISIDDVDPCNDNPGVFLELEETEFKCLFGFLPEKGSKTTYRLTPINKKGQK